MVKITDNRRLSEKEIEQLAAVLKRSEQDFDRLI